MEIQGKNGTIYVVRHGETTDNVDKKFRRASTQLTDKGIKQAEDVGEQLKNIDIPQIISSPLDRAMHTSDIILSKQEKPITKEPSTPTNLINLADSNVPFHC